MDKRIKMIGSVETRTIEECGELIHILCKAQRFGLNSFHPDDKERRPNYLLVMDEIDDVQGCLSELKHEIMRYYAAQGRLPIGEEASE